MHMQSYGRSESSKMHALSLGMYLRYIAATTAKRSMINTILQDRLYGVES